MKLAVQTILLCLLAAPAAAQEKINIKLKKVGKGDVFETTTFITEKGDSSFSTNGKDEKKQTDLRVVKNYKETIVEKEPGKYSTKLLRTYTKLEFSKDGKKIVPTFIGKEVLIYRIGKAYKFSVDAKELTGDDVLILRDEFTTLKSEDESSDESDDLFFPKQPVALNEIWKPNLEDVAKSLSKSLIASFDLTRSTCTTKLVKNYLRDGRQFGAFEIDFNLVVVSIGTGEKKINLDANSGIKATVRFDRCIDGTLSSTREESSMNSKIKGEVKLPNFEFKMEIESKNEFVMNRVDRSNMK